MRRSSAAWRNQSVRHTRPRPGRYFPPSLKMPPSFSDNFSFVRWISRSIFFHYYWSIGGRLRSWAEGCGSGVWRRRYLHNAQKKKKKTLVFLKMLVLTISTKGCAFPVYSRRGARSTCHKSVVRKAWLSIMCCLPFHG